MDSASVSCSEFWRAAAGAAVEAGVAAAAVGPAAVAPVAAPTPSNDRRACAGIGRRRWPNGSICAGRLVRISRPGRVAHAVRWWAETRAFAPTDRQLFARVNGRIFPRNLCCLTVAASRQWGSGFRGLRTLRRASRCRPRVRAAGGNRNGWGRQVSLHRCAAG